MKRYCSVCGTDQEFEEAWESSHVVALSPLAVTIVRSALAEVEGTLVVLAFRQEPEAAAWLRATKAKVEGDTAILYKRTSGTFFTQNDTYYHPGTEVVAKDWNPDQECGGGLHFCASPKACDLFRSEPTDRYVACQVAVADIVVHEVPTYPDKVKVSRCTVLYECDREGNEITAVVAVQS